MLKSTCKVDLSDIEAAVKAYREAIKAELEKIGKDAVEHAVENGNYQDRTGRLRASNKYAATDSSLDVYNDAPYAAEVEARGYDVISGAALVAEQRAKEVFE